MYAIVIGASSESIHAIKTAQAKGLKVLAFDVDSGEHEVSMRYVPNGLMLGSVLSATSIIIFFIMLFVSYKKTSKS